MGVVAGSEVTRVHAIVNPYGGRKRGLQILADARRVFEGVGVRFLTYETEYAGHARDYARSMLLEEEDVLLPIGGDGTLFEVVNGLLTRDDEQRVVVAPVPGGSSNYMGQALGLPIDDGEAAARAVVAGEIRHVDLGRVRSGERTVHGLCALSWGYVEELAACAERNRWMGLQRYTAAGLHELWRTGPRPAKLTFEGGERIDDRFSLLLCVNTEYMGRDSVLLPDARIDDGYWDVIFCRALGKIHLAEVMARMSKGDGSWLQSEHVEHRRVKSFQLETEESEPVNVDGEPNLLTPIEFDVEPAALRMVGRAPKSYLPD